MNLIRYSAGFAAHCVIILALGVAIASSNSDAEFICSGASANPWVYNFEVNGYPAKIINDATTQIPVNPGPIGPPEAVVRALESRYMNTTSYTFDNNVLYIDRPDGGMLVDAGAGPNGEGGLFAGTLLETLITEGIDPASIKNIFITHVHVDHHGGIVNNWDEFKPVYPNAIIHVSKLELENILLEEVQFGDSGLDTEQRELMSRVGKGVFAAVEGRINAFDFDGADLIPGVSAQLSAWHNVGCATFLIADGASTLAVAALNHPVLSVENPQFIFGVDYDQAASVGGRYALLDAVVDNGWTLLPEHAFFPGLMQLTRVGLNYQSHPLPWKGRTATQTMCF